MALLEQLSDELSKVERLLAQMAQGDYFEALAEARGVTYPTLAFGPPDGKPAVLAAGGELIFAFDLALLRQLSPRQIEVFEDESDGEDCYEVGTSVSPSGPFERVGRFCGRAVISLADREWIDFIRLADAADGGATVRIDAVKLGGETPRKPATRRAGGQLEVYLAQGVEAWLRAAQPLVPRAKLAGFYQTHRRVLASQGLASLDQILAPQPPVPDAKAALAVVPKTALMTRVRAYFEGLLAEDPVLLRQATGLDDAGIAALLASYHEDCADEGIEKLIRVTVPSAEEALEIMSQKAGAYAVTVHGVELEYVDREGVTRRRTINKHFRFRSLEGDWRILTTVQ